MTNQSHVQAVSQNQKQHRGDRKQGRRSARRMASDGEGQQTGAEQRPASGYPEQNPRRGQHQEGGGVDKNEVGNDLEGNDWEDEGGHQEDPIFDQPQTGDDVVPDGDDAKPIKGLGREQGRRVRS